MALPNLLEPCFFGSLVAHALLHLIVVSDDLHAVSLLQCLLLGHEASYRFLCPMHQSVPPRHSKDPPESCTSQWSSS